MNNELLNRANDFLEEISTELEVYRLKWIKYFQLKGWEWDDDLLSDTILKCYDTISRLGLRDGKKESFNYLFKALTTNYLRELEYARNKYRDDVEDIDATYEKYMSSQKSSDYKITLDLWNEFRLDYIAKIVEFNWDSNTYYLFRLKFVLQVDDKEIRKKSKNPDWKKDIKDLTKWLKLSIKLEDMKREFNLKYPEVDLGILNE